MLTLEDLMNLTADQIRAKNIQLDHLVRLRDDARERLRGILNRASSDSGDAGDLAGDDAAAFDELATLAERINEIVTELQSRKNRAAALLGATRSGSGLRIERGSIGDDDQGRNAHTPRDVAMRSLEGALKSKRLAERGAEIVEALMTTGPSASQSWAQRWAVAAGSEAYERAFAKLLTGDRGHLLWTPEESDAYRAVQALQSERAMNSSDTAGGYMVPMTLDPAITLTSAGSINPLRELARVVQISTDSWNGVTSAGVTAEWTAEAAEVSDASPVLDQPSIPVHKGDAFVPFSFEIEGDAVSFMSELSKLLADAADQLTATAYTTGSGTGQPTGLLTALAGTPASKVAPTTPEAVTASDPYTVQNALPPRFQPNTVWTANLTIMNTLRQFETAGGALKFPGLQNTPPTLLGRTVHENSNMDGTINAAATEQNYPLVYGDFGQGFVIADRIGATLELVPHLFGANRRPTGQRGALLWFRTGSDVVVPNAFRVLSVPTTA